MSYSHPSQGNFRAALVGERFPSLITDGLDPRVEERVGESGITGDCWIIPTTISGNPRLGMEKMIVVAKNKQSAFNLRRIDDVAANNIRLARQQVHYKALDFGVTTSILRVDYNTRTNDGAGAITNAEVEFWNQVAGALVKSLVFGNNGVQTPIIRLLKTDQAADPVAADLEDGYWSVFKNTTSGNVWLAVNDGGTIKKVQLV